MFDDHPSRIRSQRDGKRGQLVSYYHDECKRHLIADGLEFYLQTFAENLAANRYRVDKYGTLKLKQDDTE